MSARNLAILAALAASLAAAGVVLLPGEAVDVEASYHDPDAGLTQIILRCEQTADAGLDCGDLEALPGVRIHSHDTMYRKFTSLGGKGKQPKRNEPCYCGPRIKPNQCRVRMAEGGNRESVTGEFIPAGWAEGSGCVERPCAELSEIVEQRGLSYSLPEACR